MVPKIHVRQIHKMKIERQQHQLTRKKNKQRKKIEQEDEEQKKIYICSNYYNFNIKKLRDIATVCGYGYVAASGRMIISHRIALPLPLPLHPDGRTSESFVIQSFHRLSIRMLSMLTGCLYFKTTLSCRMVCLSFVLFFRFAIRLHTHICIHTPNL